MRKESSKNEKFLQGARAAGRYCMGAWVHGCMYAWGGRVILPFSGGILLLGNHSPITTPYHAAMQSCNHAVMQFPKSFQPTLDTEVRIEYNILS